VQIPHLCLLLMAPQSQMGRSQALISVSSTFRSRMLPILYQTWKDLGCVVVLEAKVIVDATRGPTYHGPPSMKPLRRKSAQVPPSRLRLGKKTQPLVNRFLSSSRTQFRFTQKGRILSGMMNGELWRCASSTHYVTKLRIQFWRVRRSGQTHRSLFLLFSVSPF
jgi:hypothetical protein